MSLPYTPLSIVGQYDSSAYEIEKLVVDKSCLFLAATLYNKSASTVYLMVMDKASVAGTWPTDNRGGIVEVPSKSARSIDWTLAPRTMQNGIYVCASSTDDVKTIITSADVLFGVAYAFK